MLVIAYVFGLAVALVPMAIVARRRLRHMSSIQVVEGIPHMPADGEAFCIGCGEYYPTTGAACPSCQRNNYSNVATSRPVACLWCVEPYPAETVTCPRCGKAVTRPRTTERPAETQPPERPDPARLLYLAAVALGVVGLVLILVLSRSGVAAIPFIGGVVNGILLGFLLTIPRWYLLKTVTAVLVLGMGAAVVALQSLSATEGFGNVWAQFAAAAGSFNLIAMIVVPTCLPTCPKCGRRCAGRRFGPKSFSHRAPERREVVRTAQGEETVRYSGGHKVYKGGFRCIRCQHRWRQHFA